MKKIGIITLLATFLTLLMANMATPAFAQSQMGPTPVFPQLTNVQHVCNRAPAGFARCMAIRATAVHSARGNAKAMNFVPDGYSPTDLQSAYNLKKAVASAKTSPIVAIVDAYDDPSAEADLATYRHTFGLSACTTANGCFRKVNQSGGTRYPGSNIGWSGEISLDLDMVSAICPNCHILLVEASDSSMNNLGTAVNTAVKMKAVAISNSYGGDEYYGENWDETRYYRHSGIFITTSSGDSGYGTSFPAASQYVVAVGGTSLLPASNTRGWSETAWKGAGSGCSQYISKPSWQTDNQCSKRMIADVSAVADLYTGVAGYDSFDGSGWMIYGGTSTSSPIIASIHALANDRTTNYASSIYSNASNLNDVTSGSNGNCGGSYLCTSMQKYDGPTGLGTPNGTTGL